MPEPKAKFRLRQKVSFKDDFGNTLRGIIKLKGYSKLTGWKYKIQSFPSDTGWLAEKEVGQKKAPTPKRKSFFTKKKRYFK